MEKSCIICSILKPLDEYYKHSKMGDGHLNKCKDCTKRQVKEREEKLRQDPQWLDKEKTRHREKYNRLGYREKHKPTYEIKKRDMAKYKKLYPEKTKAKNASQRMEKQKGNELHHWSYNQQHWKDVIELTRKQHAKLHRYIVYDPERMMYRRYDNNELLYTRELHEQYMYDVLANKPD